MQTRQKKVLEDLTRKESLIALTLYNDLLEKLRGKKLQNSSYHKEEVKLSLVVSIQPPESED